MKYMISMDIDKKNEKNSYGKLYICATPIGNLGDITYRVVETLRSVDIIAAEDTRNSIKLLNYFDIKTPLTSYHEFNRFDKAEELAVSLEEGKNVAVITDAGTPCISDPGEVLVQKCIERGIEITSLPGPSAAITALTLSGFSARRFVFEGFLPPKAKKREREAAVKRLVNETGTIVLYEAPHHLKDTLAELAHALGNDRRIVLCREMTKLHEEIIRTTLKEAAYLEPRGEYVLVIEGMSNEELNEKNKAVIKNIPVREHVQRYMDEGMTEKEAMKKAALDRGVSKRDIYNELKR